MPLSSTSSGDTLYLHFPCFDGLISGVLASTFLESQGWAFRQIEPLSYEIRPTWLQCALPARSAVVDFLFHPDARFWADHHLTSFVSEPARMRFQAGQFERSCEEAWLYDSSKGSCAMLLWEHLGRHFGRDTDRFREMVAWADKIDSAGYDDVNEAILGDAPALRIRASLVLGNTPDYCRFLLGALKKTTLADVAETAEVSSRSQEVRAKMRRGLHLVAQASRLESGDVIVFDVEVPPESMVSRYSPFYFYPEARYSIGLTRDERGARITAMRNPWRSFPSVPLGPLFEHYGGGGHTRVAAVALGNREPKEATRILLELAENIRKQDVATTHRT